MNYVHACKYLYVPKRWLMPSICNFVICNEGDVLFRIQNKHTEVQFSCNYKVKVIIICYIFPTSYPI